MTGIQDVAIVGIGATEFSKDSGRSELHLAVEAVRAAIADAGLQPGDVDGLTTFSYDTNPELLVARSLGMKAVRFTARTQYGGGDACATVALGAMAVAAGQADVVVAYRAFNERSGQRFGQDVGMQKQNDDDSDAGQMSWSMPFGLHTAAGFMGMYAQRYLHEYGATSADLGRVTVAARDWAATNPAAWFYGRPITLEDHQASRFIVEPFRLLDCCMESDGGVALVITSLERARDLPHRPVRFLAAAQGFTENVHLMTSYYVDDILAHPEMAYVAAQLWEQSGLRPADLDLMIAYDHFSASVLAQLEAYGICGRGEAFGFVADGHIGRGGSLPVNPHGGQLGEAYLHGMNGIQEAVRQIRGTAVNQIEGAERVLVSGPQGQPTSGLILGAA